ncbi:hypothetical protein N7532_005963 [Penicillium argentinense]|uniref:Uncharacterized protein n=1 Tax=Penicillium argentinense TaxID=1131581 RepID=A0A9W9FFD3_9EURO|nr:uncharacterized protein N7532_005963 [Penicillium argentinense]KAJ5098962.1 hypothetical protein N7532_005963 [Penicillium argentinense]
MSSLSVGTRLTRLRTRQPRLLPSLNLQNPRALHNSITTTNRNASITKHSSLWTRHTPAAWCNKHLAFRAYSPSASPTDITADNLIEELQDLYEIAKDEFEIATDSTDSATIYAASDRESARDALNQLIAVYELYTTGASETLKGSEKQGPVVETNFDAQAVNGDVRGEVKKRVGQRVRELRNAVEILEERAHDD